MTDAVAARAVRTECLIEGRFSFCQLQSFMCGMILLANQSWQDRVQEKFSILSEIPVFEGLEKWMKRNPTPETKTGMLASGFRHQLLHCPGGRVRNRSRDGSMKTSPAWFRAAHSSIVGAGNC